MPHHMDNNIEQDYSFLPVGYCIFHTTSGSTFTLFKKEDGLFYSTNLDGLDPNDYQVVVTLGDRSNYALIEPVSERRFAWMKEMAHRRVQTHDLQSLLQFMAARKQAEDVGLIQRPGPQPTQQPTQQPTDDSGPLPQPAPQQAGAAANEQYPGNIIDLPSPGQ